MNRRERASGQGHFRGSRIADMEGQEKKQKLTWRIVGAYALAVPIFMLVLGMGSMRSVGAQVWNRLSGWSA